MGVMDNNVAWKLAITVFVILSLSIFLGDNLEKKKETTCHYYTGADLVKRKIEVYGTGSTNCPTGRI